MLELNYIKNKVGNVMKKIIQFLMTNTITFSIISLFIYAFYGAIIGTSLAPSVYIIYKYISVIGLDSGLTIFLFALILGLSIYVFFITALIVFAIVERILIIGFKPGRYSTNSGIFARWLVYSGVHIILLYTVLPFMSGTPFAKLFYKILGCKIGKNVFINTRGLHDSYLLEIEDNVVIGGESNINCHIFEGNELILGKVKIGSNTLIGASTYIMPGATIGKKCNIGVYSYIRKNRVIPDNSIIMAIPGVPAKKVAEIIREKKEQ